MADWQTVTGVIPPTWPDRDTYDRAFKIGRANWQVAMSPTKVINYAQAAADYHRERQSWWKHEQQMVRDKISDEGVEVREQQITGGVRHDVIIDPKLSARLSECESKERGHKNQADSLEEWVDFLCAFSSPEEASLIVTSQDMDYFEIGQHG